MNDNDPGSSRVIRLRVLHLDTHTTDLGDVSAIGVAELDMCGTDAVIGAIRTEPFDPADRPCTPADFTAAATWPDQVDVLVAYDLSRVEDVVPADMPGFACWIGVGRLLTQLGHDVIDKGPTGMAIELGQGAGLTMAPTDGTTAARDAVATALLAAHLYPRMDLASMLRFSRAKTKPLWSLPDLHDWSGWAGLPRADLHWLADHQEARRLAGLDPDPVISDAVSHRAVVELNRRRIWARVD